jgi:tRNA(Ile)-lysidine synthetase-like protein
MTNKVDCLKLINFIERSNLFTTNQIRNKKLLIAFSGGQDSSCLLTIFYILSKKWDFKLGAVYCNHCWGDSTQTSSSVFENLQMFDIPFYFVESPNSEPMKPEQKARNWRYSAFYTISKWENYDFVLTGHTLSDSVETTLFNLFRGSGLKGICSLKENQNFDDLKTKDFFFKKNVCFWDPFFSFGEKNGNHFFRKYRLFKKLCSLRIFPKVSFFVITESCAIYKFCMEYKAAPKFLLKTKLQNKALDFLTCFGSKKKFDFWFFCSVRKTNIKKNRLTRGVTLLKSSFPVKERIGFTRRIKILSSLQSYGMTNPFIDVRERQKEDFNFQAKAKKGQKKYVLFSSNMKTDRFETLGSFSFFFQNKKMEKQNSNLFQLYLKKIKEFQNTDKLNSFITLFKPFVLKKRSNEKKLTFQIQRLIRKKEKEKRCIPCKAEIILSSSFFKLINKHKLLSSQLEKKGLKLIKQLRINKDKKVLLQSSFPARESLLLCKAIPNNATLHGMPSFVFEQLAKPYINGKITGKQINGSDHLEVLIDKLVQKSSDKKKFEFTVIRPLIKINRETLFLFSTHLKLPVYYDKSNKDLNITRNYIRKVLIPLLKKINPRVEENIYKFSKIVEFYYQLAGDLKCPSDRFDIFNS